MYTCSWIWISAETTFTFTQGPVIFAGHEDAIWWTTKLPGPTVLELPFSYSSLASSALFFSFSSSFLHTFFFLRPSIATGESKSIHQRSSIRRCLPAVYEPLYLFPPPNLWWRTATRFGQYILWFIHEYVEIIIIEIIWRMRSRLVSCNKSGNVENYYVRRNRKIDRRESNWFHYSSIEDKR